MLVPSSAELGRLHIKQQSGRIDELGYHFDNHHTGATTMSVTSGTALPPGIKMVTAVSKFRRKNDKKMEFALVTITTMDGKVLTRNGWYDKKRSVYFNWRKKVVFIKPQQLGESCLS